MTPRLRAQALPENDTWGMMRIGAPFSWEPNRP
jgi:hypothetical protein